MEDRLVARLRTSTEILLLRGSKFESDIRMASDPSGSEPYKGEAYLDEGTLIEYIIALEKRISDLEDNQP